MAGTESSIAPPTSTLNAPILLVESDDSILDRAMTDLKNAGYAVATAKDAQAGLTYARDLPVSLIVVDRLLVPGESGLWLCNQLRELGNVAPVLLIMARDEVEDRAACLEAGADDYLLKPYRSEKLLELVRLYLRPTETGTPLLHFADLALDLDRRTAIRNGHAIALTMKEFELLRYLMENPREVLTREQILENVWGYDFMGESNIIEVYVRYLRLKLEDESQKRLIQTVRGVGYVLRET